MPHRKLRITIKANALFSMVSGVALLLIPGWISGLLSLDNELVLRLIGIGLLLFALMLLWTATRDQISRRQVHTIIIQDCLWVVASVVIIVTGAFDLSRLGYVLMAFLAFIVADLALLEGYYLKRPN